MVGNRVPAGSSKLRASGRVKVARPLPPVADEIGVAAQFLLDLVVLDVAHAEAQPQPILGLVAGEARIGAELLAVVAQERELDALLDLPGVAGIDVLDAPCDR